MLSETHALPEFFVTFNLLFKMFNIKQYGIWQTNNLTTSLSFRQKPV
jgi:hypothetical protein